MDLSRYQIRVQGHLEHDGAGWFDGMQIADEPSGEAVITSPMLDQAALHGLLNQVFGLNLTLISVCRLANRERGN